jgi:hypothetical protein
MAKYLSAKSAVSTQIKILGKLAVRLDTDGRVPLDVMIDFFALNDQERQILLDSYDGDDRIDAVVR